MGNHKLEATAETTHRLAQRAAEHQTEGADALGILSPQHDPLAQVSCRLGDASCADAHAARLNRTPASQPVRAAQSLLQLQRQYGNRYVQRVVALARQSKSGAADRVVPTLSPRLQRKCACGGAPGPDGECAECRMEQLGVQRRSVQRVWAQAQNSNGAAEAVPEIEAAIQRVRSGGQALDGGVRVQMEAAFGANFSDVRVHTDAEADMLNRALSARAFTTGRNIFFREGEYRPGSSDGRQLLAHELTHVVQQAGGQVQPKLIVGAPDDVYEQEADRVARAVMQQEQQATPMKADAGLVRRQMGKDEEEEESIMFKLADAIAQRQMGEEGERGGKQTKSYGRDTRVIPIPQIGNRIPNNRIGKLIQRVPVPGSNFGTYRYCGFGITNRIPGFIQNYFTGSFDVDYTTGCTWIWAHAWSSVWELYDSADRKLDTNTESPFGEYTIEADKINAGTPGDGRAKWSLWYRITRSQPWLTDDPDAFPYHYVLFDVYSLPIKNPNTQLREETGPVVWQDNFTPAEDGASLEYNFSTTASRTTTESQTTTVSGTVSGERSSNIGFEYEGLTGGFANRLNYSATVSLSRTHSVSVQTSQTTSKRFTQPNLRGGVTYRVVARPLYHIIDGSVDLIRHRDGVISESAETVTGGIRVLKGMDIRLETEPTALGRGRWSCDASCNVEGTESHCTGRVTGHSSGHSSEEEACREAKRDATQKAPRNCYARHCRCFNCTNR